MDGTATSLDRPSLLAQLARHLVGEGIELGPGHSPFPLPFPGTVVRYVDRWEPDANRGLFPELGDAAFPMPDVVADLDVDRLGPIASESADFVIASHVLEHMANPLAILGEIHRVLRRGGVGLILLPDRTRTFDRAREATPLAHLVAEHEADVTTVSDVHVEDFLRGVGEWDENWSADERSQHLHLHLQRSIHVHCWTQDEFPDVLVHSIEHQGMAWELVDAVFVQDVTDSIEFGYVLRRALDDCSPSVHADRFRAVLGVLRQESDRQAAMRCALDGTLSVPLSWEGQSSGGTRWYSGAANPLVQLTRQGGTRIRNRIRGRSA